MTNTYITLNAVDGTGTFTAYTAGTAGAPVVLVIQEIFGITDGLKQQCQQYADLGYYVVCPDLFWRQQPNVSLSDNTAPDVERAFALFNGFDVTTGLEDIFTTITHCNAPAAVVGYCLGGMLAYLTGCYAAKSLVKAAVSYYAVGLDMIDNLPIVPTLMHFAEHDEYCSAQVRSTVQTRICNMAHIRTALYPNVHHAFARVNGVNYNAEMAALANQRTVEFLQQHLPVAR